MVKYAPYRWDIWTRCSNFLPFRSMVNPFPDNCPFSFLYCSQYYISIFSWNFKIPITNFCVNCHTESLKVSLEKSLQCRSSVLKILFVCGQASRYFRFSNIFCLKSKFNNSLFGRYPQANFHKVSLNCHKISVEEPSFWNFLSHIVPCNENEKQKSLKFYNKKIKF